jgi:dinuclear metal center YbgI/SA1388 family protein
MSIPEAKLVFAFLDELLAPDAEVDYPGAWNGVQVEGEGPVRRIGAAVDASERIIDQAVGAGVDLLVVHHGLFWDPDPRLCGARYRKAAALLAAGIRLYASHLPLDRHPDVGNAALLMRAAGWEPLEPFGMWKGLPTGWLASAPAPLPELEERLAAAVEGPVRTVAGGPSVVSRIAVVTGAGASFLADAQALGVDTLVTGEAPHHAWAEAHERGMNLVLAGHYRTETFGVRAVTRRVAEHFSLPWTFLDDPSGF